MSDPNASVLAAVESFVAADAERKLGAYGLHVSLPGADPIEHRFRSDDRVNLYSVAKTFTAVALLLAESEGRLGLDDRVLDHLVEYRDAAADGFDQVTIRQLLTMTSGTSHLWFADQPIPSLDLLRDVITAPVGDRRFEYTGSGPYVAGRVLHRATGADLLAYLNPRLFEPLGIHNPAWHGCPAGFPFAESDLFLRTDELARFTRLLADKGEYAGRRILPESVVEGLTTSPADTEPDLRPDGAVRVRRRGLVGRRRVLSDDRKVRSDRDHRADNPARGHRDSALRGTGFPGGTDRAGGGAAQLIAQPWSASGSGSGTPTFGIPRLTALAA